MDDAPSAPAAGPATEASTPAPAPVSRGAAQYSLFLLLVVYVFNFIDRSILSILLEPIKEEFQVSDTYLGFLSGIAFAVFYTFVGIPVARWADRGSRRNIIALALFVWSGMTAVTGLSRSFAHLAIARIGVGIGEAGCSPPAHSLISDLFPPERRATALSVYALGIPIGGGIGFLAGGWLNELFDWRTAFIVVGLPGVLLAAIVRLTLPEPPRGAYDGPMTASARQESVGEVLRFLWSLRAFRHISMGAALHAFYGYGAQAFIAAFFIRSHGMETGEIGTWLAAIAVTGGVAGTYMGGYISDRLGVRDVRWYTWVPALATTVYVPFAFLLYLWPDARTALVMWIPGAILGGMYLGPTFAMTQSLVRPRMRATASAILLFIINIIGLGLGPQGVGILSDLLVPVFAGESLRYALLIIVVGFALWSVLHYALSSLTLRDDLRAKERAEAAPASLA
jgi:MFS family permease